MTNPAAPKKGEKAKALLALHLVDGLSPSARIIGAWLIQHANATTGRCDPGQSRLQALSGFSESAVKRATKELAAKGIIAKQHRGATASTAYVINWPLLSGIAEEKEALAKHLRARREVVSELTGGGVNSGPSPVSSVTPKHSEENTLKETVFPVDIDQRSMREKDGDDAIGRKILRAKEDTGFLFPLDRAVTAGRLFSAQVAYPIYDRLHHIHERCEFGSPIAGLASRLLETDFVRNEMERDAA